MNVRRTAALSALPLALVLVGASPALASGGGGGDVRVRLAWTGGNVGH